MIKYNSDYLPASELRKELTKEEEVFIALLEENKDFEFKIQTIRKDLAIPPTGLEENEMIPMIKGNDRGNVKLSRNLMGTYIEALRARLSQQQFDLLNETALQFCKKYNLPFYWKESFMCFITFDVFPVPKLDSFEPIAIYEKGILLREQLVNRIF